LPLLAAEERLLGVAAAGSFATDRMDEYSDLDLVLCCEPVDHASLIHDRMRLAASLGELAGAFSGEHVGEPRLLICLYGPPALHVDLKFVSVEVLAVRVDEPVVLWERDNRMTHALRSGTPRYPLPDGQWIEDRFWVWIHYAAAKIGRGELQEAVEFLSYLRVTVLGPLALFHAGLAPNGVRRVESDAPAAALELAATVARPDRTELLQSIRRAIEMYRRLRDKRPGLRFNLEGESVACEFLEAIAARTDTRPKPG
jgi:hypothetical protein